MRSLACALALGCLAGCWDRHVRCPPGYTPVCQSGERYGTRCVCEPPRRYGDPR